MRCLGVLLVLGGGVARADVYPETAVDRPLLMYRWMGSADLSLDLSHYTDSDGTKHVDSEGDVFSAFSLGRVEFSLHIVGASDTASASVQVGNYGAVRTSFEYYFPRTTYSYAFAQELGYAYKALVVPHRLALYFTGWTRLLEESLTPAMMPASAGSALWINVGASAQFQLTRHLAIDQGFTFYVPALREPADLADRRREHVRPARPDVPPLGHLRERQLRRLRWHPRRGWLVRVRVSLGRRPAPA
jgi:hypothetical protein